MADYPQYTYSPGVAPDTGQGVAAGISTLGSAVGGAIQKHEKDLQVDGYNDLIAQQALESGQITPEQYAKYNGMSRPNKTGFVAGINANAVNNWRQQQANIALTGGQAQKVGAEAAQVGPLATSQIAQGAAGITQTKAQADLIAKQAAQIAANAESERRLRAAQQQGLEVTSKELQARGFGGGEDIYAPDGTWLGKKYGTEVVQPKAVDALTQYLMQQTGVGKGAVGPNVAPSPTPTEAPAAPAEAQQAGKQYPGTAIVRVSSIEEAQKLKPGTRYMTPDGQVIVR
jgi:hypothetical protein